MAVQTQEQLNMAKKAATELGITIPETINSADLTRNTTTPKITPAVPSTAGAGVLGAVQSSQDQFTQMMQDRAKEAAANKDKSLSDYTTRLFDTPTATELKADQYDKQGVDSAQRELDDINSQIQVEQHALQREIERIQDNAVGAFGGQVQNMVREAENKSLRKQADLAVIQMGLQGKFNTAKAIADRAVDAATEREKNIIEALKINYEDNKALFTTAEQREFDTLLSNRERVYEEDKANKKQISDYSIEAMKMGAPGDVITAIRGAKTPEEAQALAADYIAPKIAEDRKLDIMQKQASIRASQQSVINSQNDLLFKRAELGDTEALRLLGISSDPSTKVRLTPTKAAAIQKEVANNDAYKALVKATDSISALKGYETKFKEVGTTSAFGSPFENSKLKTVYNKAVLNLKEFYNLGVLNGPDLEVIQSTLGNPTDRSFLAGIGSLGISSVAAYKGAEEGIKTTYNQIEQTLDDRYLALRSQYGNYDSSQVSIVDDIDRRYLDAKAQVNPNVSKFLAENPDMPLEDIIQVINTKF